MRNARTSRAPRRGPLPTLAIGSAALLGLAPRQDARLTPVDQGVADRGALSASHRQLPPDFRAPTGFDRLYRVESRTPLFRGQSAPLYARVQGGIIAVFPQSEYRDLGRGLTQVRIPAGTIYLLRDPTPMLGDPGVEPAAPSNSLMQRLNERIGARRDAEPDPRDEETPRPRSMWEDEGYRHQRLESLLARAHRAGG
ncbi:MAG TPA: hypothetical protein VD971_00570 [Phycisphaerales bacterium]|nr:hypothetical protein [Phycisphaerales bacterium]